MSIKPIGDKNGKNPTFRGKIAIITDPASLSEDAFHSPDVLVKKYGADKIIHVTWPEDFMDEQAIMVDTVARLAADREVRVLIINQAIEGSNAAVDKLKETRDDVFVIYCNTNENSAEVAARANLILSFKEPRIGAAIVKQARKQGAKVFVHYSFPRHLSHSLISQRRDLIQQECLKEGILFIDATAPDPADGIAASQQFILDDVPKYVAQYGEETAFFSTNCQHQTPLIRAIVETHALYPQPCCPSPYHSFPEALGFDTKGEYIDLRNILMEASSIAAEKNMTDRLSTWPVSASVMFTTTGGEYAIRWLNGKVPKTGISNKALIECMNAYIIEVIGEESNIIMWSHVENGVTYENYKGILMSYLDI